MSFDCLTQRIELNYLIPAIRLEIIKLLEKKGMKDAEISRRLRITKAAVSQYKHNKRGTKLKFPEEIRKAIEKSADLIMKGKLANKQISSLIEETKSNRYICCVCKGCEKS